MDEREQAENRESRRNKILHALASGEPLDHVMDLLVKSEESEDPESICSILLLDRENGQLLHGAGPSLPDFYNQAIHGLKIEPGAGSCGNSAYTGQLTVVADVLTHPYWSEFRDLALQADIRACWSQPVFSAQGEVIATFAIYYRQPRSPDQDDLERIQTAANLASLAIERKQAEEALRRSNEELEELVNQRTRELEETNESLRAEISNRKQAEDELRKREEHMQAILQATHDPLVVYDKQGHPQYINPSFSQVFGWTLEELQGQRIPFVPEDQKELTLTKIREIYSTGIPTSFDTKRLTKDNRLLDIRVSAAIIQSSLQGHYGLVVILTDITERKQMEEKLKELSLHDSLTGLYSRNFFEEEMKRLSNGRYNPLGIIVCDVDGLKFINDTLGHQFGDQVLLTTADILRRSFRSSDIIARIGGDEFAILLTETDPEIVEQIQQRLRQAVQDYNSTNPDIPISLSLGLALSEGETVDMEALFREADNRMYREKIQRVGSARSDILQAINKTMQARDFDTEGHCDRLQELAASLARSLELSQESINDLILLARFHDLGKVGIPDHILFKPGALTEEEWQQMRQHCEIGHRIASSVPDLEPIADFILKHHEWWDGRGYPQGLAGEDIPLPCRILAIVDAYDAMTSDRPYRRAMTREEAIAELRRCAGTQFDPELVEKFIKIIEEADGG